MDMDKDQDGVETTPSPFSRPLQLTKRMSMLISKLYELVDKKEIMADCLKVCEETIYDMETDLILNSRVVGNIFTGINCDLLLEEVPLSREESEPHSQSERVYNWERCASNSSTTRPHRSLRATSSTTSSASSSSGVQMTENQGITPSTTVFSSDGSSTCGTRQMIYSHGDPATTSVYSDSENLTLAPAPLSSSSSSCSSVTEMEASGSFSVPIGQPRYHRRAQRHLHWSVLPQRESFALHKVSKDAYHQFNFTVEDGSQYSDDAGMT